MTDTDLNALAERLRSNDRNERVMNHAEAMYWLGQWRMLAHDYADALDRLAASGEWDQKGLNSESGHQTEQAGHVPSQASK